MKMSYDVIVIGAGPAGGQCARELAEKGKKVLLVDKAKNFAINNSVLLYGFDNSNLNVPIFASPEIISAAINATSNGTCTNNNCNMI